MATKKQAGAENVGDTGSADPERQARWEAFLERVKAQNPRQFALDETNGEFKSIPATFV